ncbi:HlyD family type I secretion periplasmic adaptor subunit [Ideonella sp.]|uniref:HlyD family type I secretion periplasmic adaptor subunit n=1 Tax=Ideonella sp. TaxID=1929293 RepID=UPI0035B44198
MSASTTVSLPRSPDDALATAWQASARRLIAGGSAAIALTAAALLAWATWAPLSGAIVAQGVVKVDSNRKTVQHRDGGIVREILVHEGDRVAAGQALIQLDDRRIDATFDLTRSQLDALRIKLSRLSAEHELAANWLPPADYRQRQGEPRIAEALAREAALFTARRSALDSQLRLVQRQIDEVATELAAREREHSSVNLALADMQEELSVNEALLAQAYVNRTRVLGLKRNVAEYRMKIEGNRAEASKARQRSTDLALRLAGLREAFAQDASTDLRDTSAKIVDLEEQLRAASDAAQRLLIAAPVAGRVVDLRVSTPGGTIGPRDPLLDIVPDGSPLLVEARVGVDAISELQPGQATDVRLTAYRQRTTPLISGKLVYVSADSLADRQTGVPYYLVHVELDPSSLRQAGEVSLRPGMAAEVFVRTRERTPLDYLLEPLANATRRSFREH